MNDTFLNQFFVLEDIEVLGIEGLLVKANVGFLVIVEL